MKRKIFLLLCSSLLLVSMAYAQSVVKKPLTHAVYDGWKTMAKPLISDNGKFVSYEINPQKGDGWLHLQNPEANRHDSLYRGQSDVFSSNSDLLAFRIVQPEDTLHKLKLAKKKKDELPKDSLGIWLLEKDTIIRFAGLKSFQLPKEGGAWVAWLYEKPKEKEKNDKSDTVQKLTPDTLTAKPKEVPGKPKDKDKKKKKGAFADIETANLTLLNPIANQKFESENVTETAFAKNGSLLTFITLKKDSIDSIAVNIFDTRSLKMQKIFEKPGFAKKVMAANDGKSVAFLFTSDTAKVKRYGLYLWDEKSNKTNLVADTSAVGVPSGWEVSENGTLVFSDDGNKLYFGTAPKKLPESKDTLLDEEKVKVDIWSWNDGRLQSQQLKKLDDDLKKNYLSVYRIAEKRIVQLADTLMEQVRTFRKGNADFALGTTNKPYEILSSWEGTSYRDIFLVDTKTGSRRLLLKKHPATAELSPAGKYLLYYEIADSTWNTLQVATGKKFCLTGSLPVSFSDEENDQPDQPNPYGIGGWTTEDASVLIYDRYDIWLLNPENKTAPVLLTANGRVSKTEYRYVKTDPEALDINPKEPLLLKATEDVSCRSGYAKLLLSEPGKTTNLIISDHEYFNPLKAKNAQQMLWQRSSYIEYPDLWTGTSSFTNVKKLSTTNPQQNQYLWGSVEHVSWTSFDGGQLRGLLYKPENFNPSKKYPMIAYFYEKYSNEINSHYVPSPSRSIVNFTFYNSNGYIVFVPDINYRSGEPGRSAYDDIISGTMAMTKLPYIDADRMGIQGQSWGGYQVAYLVTQTGMFKAAMAGAPVSNMTSAYGGIRWESGIVRQSQYEHGQSRLGANLWENRNLYIENSPIFYANKITTPLLIMSNDNDGAVPYYQGIELITAMRRLQKPAWLLCYNGEEHNLTKRPSRQDLSIRMSQFFDHYLKNAPEPQWMKQGVPAVVKGKELRYGE
ncbi:MAG: prolyl oligopeptidase family serine peptidase [Bacteroidales bacterium]|nr:prolyl oligopeptidase family serine peptidase [Bacteroidales bacterium]